MIIFDEKPSKLKRGVVINWVSVDEFVEIDVSAKLVNAAFSKNAETVKRYTENYKGDLGDLLGTSLKIKAGGIIVYNIFYKRTVGGKQCINPFAAVKGLRTILEELSKKPKTKCYIGVMDDDPTWKNIQKIIPALEGKYKITMWLWTN